MSKEMIISVNGREKKIAILENGRVTEYYIERGEDNTGVVGNIYKGKVMRVLPGMQSAFVNIGLDRDAFLYVSDFFDEEEEIERIVVEKSKQKRSKAEVEREAKEEVTRSRLKRERKMEDAQEKAESVDSNAAGGKKDKKKTKTAKQTKRSTKSAKSEKTTPKDGKTVPKDEKTASKERQRKKESAKEKQNVLDVKELDFTDSGFERIVDEDDETGEMLKDAMLQEAITDTVRSIEFEMESTESAEVGSLIDSVGEQANGFERVADEEEEEEEKPAKRRTAKTRRSASSTKKGVASKKSPPARKTKTEGKAAKDKKPASGKTAGAASRKAKTGKTKKTSGTAKKPGKQDKAASKGGDLEKELPKALAPAAVDPEKQLPDGEAEINDGTGVSEMAVRRGSRGGRRKSATSAGKKPAKTETHTDKTYKSAETDAKLTADAAIADAEFKKTAKPKRRGRRRDREQAKITDLLSQGQEILVQIAKEPIAKKGARITSHIALPGRFIVYMPTIEHLGVSRKIGSTKERSRLRSLIEKIVKSEKVPSGGFIVRTAGVGKTEAELRKDARYLLKAWQDIKNDAEKARSPALIHEDLNIIERLLRDHLSEDFTAIRVDSEDEYLRIVEFVNLIQPEMVKRVKFHTLDESIFDVHGVSEEVNKALKHRVWLRSGGYLVINQTEALIAIDVNTGKFVGKGNARLEDTITKTNLEAVDEIARQIRLRDLGGIIVLDLIDMEDRNNRRKVLHALQENLNEDKSPTKVLSFNDFGLIIMTRKRVKQSLERTLCAPCSYCEGAGWIKSPQTVCYEILDEARRLSKGLSDVRETTLRVHPVVAETLRDFEKEVFDEIEQYLGVVDVSGDGTVHQEQFDFAFV